MTDQTEKLYHYTGCGLDNVYLQGGYKTVQTPRGQGVSIDDVPGLYEAITRAIITDSTSLKGQEIRFLRRRLRMTQDDLASVVGVDKQTIGRWERDDTPITVAGERWLRAYVLAHVDGDTKMKRLIEYAGRLRSMDEGRTPKCHAFDYVNHAWSEAVAA